MYIRKRWQCQDPKSYEQYYCGQIGGTLPVFAGASMQRGYGLGNVFGSLARMAMPLFKRGAKELSKRAMSTGVKFAGDVMLGRKPKAAAKRRGTEFLQQAVGALMSPPGERIKKKRKRRVVSQTRTKKKKTASDIFS